MPLRVSCAPCRATVSRVVPACCAFIEVHSRSRACPQPTAIRVRATRRRAPPIGRAPPPDPCRARAARSFPRTPPMYLTLSPAHYAHAVRRALPARTLTLFPVSAPACSVQRSSLAALCVGELHSVFMFNGGNIGYTHCILSLVVATLLRDLRPCLHRRRFRLFLLQVMKRSCNFRMRGNTLRGGRQRKG